MRLNCFVFTVATVGELPVRKRDWKVRIVMAASLWSKRFLLINSSPQFGQDKAALEQSIPLQLGPEIYK